MKIKRLGTSYGGWVIPLDYLDKEAICYCAGAGEDISFDVALINTFGCHVYSFDPTPRAIAHVTQLIAKVRAGQSMFINHNLETTYRLSVSDLDKLHFFDYGLFGESKHMRFYAPQKASHVSHSVLNLQRTDRFFEAPCKNLSAIMEELGHSRLDLLKLDIEGAEYSVLDDMIRLGIRPRILCVEFDEALLQKKSDNANKFIRKLVREGYSVIDAHQWNFTFVYQMKPTLLSKIVMARHLIFS